MAKCFNKNLPEYQALKQEFKDDIVVDSIISKWQSFKKSDDYPTLAEAKAYLRDAEVAFSLKTKDFAEVVLTNLSRKGLISWSNQYKTYFVNNTRGEEVVENQESLEANLKAVYRYLEFNNIPKEVVSLQKTPTSYAISIQDSVFTPKDILPSSRTATGTHTNQVLRHLKRMFPQINIAVVDVKTAENYYDSLPSWQKAKVPFDEVNSFYVDGQVVLIKGRVTNETAIEEVLHPFIDAAYAENPELFKSLLEEAKKNFPVLAQEIEEAYNTEYRKFSEKDRELELVTQALTRYFKKEYEENPTKTFKERVKEFLEWFAGIINNLHKYITGINIPSLRSSEIVQPSQQQSVKPGVEELFESNPELANQVYEALGFKVSNSSISLDKINNTKVGEVVTLFINNMPVKYKRVSENYFEGKQITKKQETDFINSLEATTISIEEFIEKEGTKVRYSLDEFIDFYLDKLPTSQITPQQEQQAKQLYSQYLQTTNNPTVGGFKQWNKNKGIKPGVEELFNSNPTLANAVYEALGFKSKPDVILPIGTSGSGKSTFIKSLPQDNLVIIEPDAMRVEFTGDMNDKSKDKEIYIEAANRAIKTIKQGKQVVFDTTNLTKGKRLPFIEAIKKEIPNANIQYKLMALNPELAKQRIKAQLARGENRANVSDETIDRHAASYKQMLEDIKNEPISNFEITPQQKQQAQELYAQYLDTIFPNSKVKDIVYHGSNQKINQFEIRKEPLIHFGSKNAALQRGNILNEVLLNIKDLQTIKDGMWFLGTDEGGLLKELLDRNILTIEQVKSINEAKNKAIQQSPYFNENYRMALPEGEKAGNKKLQAILKDKNIGFEYKNLSEDKGSTSFAVPSQEQIHILGSKQDIEGFKEFVSKPKQSEIKLSITLPNYTIETLTNKDGSKRLAQTDGTQIKINPVKTVEEFFDYFTGKAGGISSEQKKLVLDNLTSKGYSLNRIKSILNTIDKVNAFLVLHEQDHIDNKDKDVYWLNGRDLLTPDKVNIETRATINALKILQEKPTVYKLDIKDINPNTKLSDIAKLLNTSELEFRLEKAADRKVRYALSKDKQKAIDQISSRANDLQKQMINKLFHIASTKPQEVSGLPVSREDITQGDDIVILNEQDHIYYNLNDLTKQYVSTTTAIGGKLQSEDDVQMNLAVGNDFDKIAEGIALYKTFDEVKDSMQILNEEQARRAFNNLEGYISAIRSLGDVVIPQVVVHYNNVDGSNIAGTIDLLVITPQGKLKIIDIKTSKNRYSTSEDGKYNTEWNIKDDSLLKAFGVEKLSTKQKHNLQVNLYRRMLENMGYQMDTSDHAVSTFHIWVDIEGEGKDQKFNGNFELENAVFHPISQNETYVNALVPRDKNLISADKIKKAIRNNEAGAVLEDKDYLDAQEAARQAEGQDATEFGGIEMEVYYEALRNYRENLVTRREVIQSVKGTVYMDRSQEEAVERISTTIAMATLALASSETETKRIFTELLLDAKKELESYEKYLLDESNAKNSDYITRARNYDNFAKTFEGLYLLRDSQSLNNTQKNLILSIQNTLNRLSSSTIDKLSTVDAAIFNHVKAIVREKSSRDFSTYTDPITGEEVDPFEKLFKEAVDISTVDYLTRDTNTSPDTLLAIMKKLWHQERQKVLDRIQERENDIAMLGSRLARLSPGKSMKDIFSFIIELDENGNHTGRYVSKIGSEYYDKLYALRAELTDEQGEWLQYRQIDDLSKARPEDIAYNKALFAKKQAYSNFLRAETLGSDKQFTGGEYHEYTKEWYDIRSRYQDFIPTGEHGMWVFKAGISQAEKETFLAKHFNAVEVNSPIFKDDVFTGKTIKKIAHFPLKKYIKIREKTASGKDMRSEKYKAIMDASATDALAVARRTFYLAYMKHFQEALDKLPQNVADSMLGKTPRIASNLTGELKVNSDGAKELWARTVRSVSDFTKTTTRLTRVNIDERGNIVSSIPIMYTGSLRSQEAIEKLEAEIADLKNKYANTPQANSETYNNKLLELESRLASLRSKPTAQELSFDMVGTLLKFSAMAENYEVMSAIEDTMIAFQQVIEKRQYKENSSRIKKIARRVKGKKDQDVYMKKRANVKMAAEKFMEMVFYDEEDVTKGMLEKAVDKLLSYTSLSYVAFNVFGNFNNYMLGRLNNGVEVLGQRFFSKDAYIRASKEFNKRAISDLIRRASYKAGKVRVSGAFDPYKPISKYEAFVYLFRMMDSKGDIRESGRLTDKIGKSYLDKFVEFGYSFQDAAEYNVQTKVGMAILMDTYILNETTGEILSLYDAFEFNGDQELELKDGFTTIVKPKKEIPTFRQALKGTNIKRDDKGNMLYDVVGQYNDEFRYNLRYKIREVNKQIHGNYTKEDRMVLQTYTLGKILAQFHKWVAPAIRARWQAEYFDENLGWLEGRYISYIQFMKYVSKNLASIFTGKQDSIKGFMDSLGFKDDGSQADERIINKVLNMHRVNGEIATLLMLYAVVALLRGIWQDDDDEETIKKLKNLARYQADRAKKEMILFIPSLGGGRQVLEFFESPFAVTRTLGELGGALDATWDYGKNGAIYLATKDEEDWFYNKDVYYQRGRRTGTLKVNKEWSDVVPILYEMKKWDDFIQLNNFFIK